MIYFFRHSIFLIVGLLAFTSNILEAQFHKLNLRISKPIANVELPKHVSAPKGKLTLYADYHNADKGKIPLYLVNRTTKEVSLNAQDHDIYVKLERKKEDGSWERVQPHVYSWCGNSYYPVTLASGHHFAFSGYFPPNGTAAQVRYRSYGQNSLISNQGKGFYLEKDKQTAGLDDMALRELPAPLRRYFRIDEWTKHDPLTGEKFLSALRLASAYQDNPYVRRAAKKYLEKNNQINPNAEKIAAAIQKVLKQKWPPQKNTNSLLNAAFKELPAHPAPAWLVLNDFIRRGLQLDDEVKIGFEQKVADELKKSLERDNHHEIKNASLLLSIPSFAGEYFNNAFFEKWIRSSHDSLIRECANALSRRKKHSELAQIGFELSPHAQLMVLHALASSGVNRSGYNNIRNPHSTSERNFWIHCARKQPVETVSTLYFLGKIYNGNSFNLTIHKPLREFLIKEAQNPNKKIDSYKISQVVSFIGAWKRKEDIEILRALLNHPSYQLSTGTKSGEPNKWFEFREYRVRREAKRLLLEMGEAVPENLVLKEDKVIPRP